MVCFERLSSIMRYRFENFGGIISAEDPPFLALVDREYMRELGLGPSDAWKTGDHRIGLLSAPTEVHAALTNLCHNDCRYCYMASQPEKAPELDRRDWGEVFRRLAEWGVFHIALGGGEALLRPDLFELAAIARRAGLVPNLSISGDLVNRETARRMRIFGQVNVSIDGVGDYYSAYRRRPGLETATRALEFLLSAGVSAGINCVVGRRTFPGISGLFAFAMEKGAGEIEFLRYKPRGRAADDYCRERLTQEQYRRIIPLLIAQGQKSGLKTKIDCSFAPFLAETSPDRNLIEIMAAYGCEAGNALVGIQSDGTVSGCSFLSGGGLRGVDLPGNWRRDPHLIEIRSFAASAPEPCRSCPYLNFCRGGCRAVALHLTGSVLNPDPECPRVERYRQEGS